MKARIWVIIFAVIIVGVLYYFNCNTCINCAGITGGNLKPCDTSFACVNTQAENPKHAIDPIPYSGSLSPIPRLRDICKTFPKSRIIKATDTYLLVEFRSKYLSWVDDAEFLWVPSKQKIEMRAAARCGFYDFHKNRERLETIRKQFSGD